MIKEELFEEGIVSKSENGIAVVYIQGSEKCKECHAKIFCKPGNSEGRLLTVHDSIGVNPGDRVKISIKGSRILIASLFLYGIPLVLLLTGIFAGMEIFKKNMEVYSSFLGFILIIIYWLIAYLFSHRKKVNSYPEIINVLFKQ